MNFLHAGSHLLEKYLLALLVHNINKLDKCVAIATVTLLLVSIHYTVFVLHA